MTKKLEAELPDELLAELNQEAQVSDRSVSAVLEQALKEYFESEKQGRAFALEDDCND